MKLDIAPGDGDPRHGTPNGYTNYACRCPDCRGANAAQHRGLKLRRDPARAPVHGRASTYGNWKCRCRSCTTAWAVDHRERKARR